ncbi:hypothetical protein RVIR1_00250 [Candidatus Rickettsiella viridis]|uniref:Uncharacterized protein n=1 Tax=Candidatus Rickettsiella viridis TaxID=676208 RepID=A0A2Z5V6S6_9COXI|nr:hypothetical protein [Candidatus Rickettsiella viridis]BBB14567.1 hypothetical protein RVIR1_00250 [Candidatus Rickettsiella viridis]
MKKYETIKIQLHNKKRCFNTQKNVLKKMKALLNETKIIVNESKNKLDSIVLQEKELAQNDPTHKLQTVVQQRIQYKNQLKQDQSMLNRHQFFILDTKCNIAKIENEITQLKNSLKELRHNL